jgi:hypothetical protein
MKPSSLLIKCAVIVISTVGAIQCHAAESLCADNEKVYFSCEIKRKILSLCLNKTSSQLHYKFGENIEKPELVFPNPNGKGSHDFYSSYEGGAKSGSQTIGFAIGQYMYVVFETRSAFGYNGAGVAISKNEKMEAVMQCNKGSLNSDNFFGKAEELGFPEKALIYPTTEYMEAK